MSVKTFRNQSGFSLPEILLTAGLVGAISLGASKFFLDADKKRNAADQSLNQATIEKMLEASFFTQKGCDQLKTKRPGDELQINVGPMTVKQNLKIGNTTVTGLKFESFFPVDPENVKGIAKILLTLKRENREVIREIPVPVNMQAGAVEDCRLNQTQTFQKIMEKICAGSFGPLTNNLDCSAAIALVEKRTIQEICKDAFGSNPPQFQGIKCDLDKIHANKSCGFGGKAVGFDGLGNIICG